ncbi:putative reverse transcriptase domain-containing protein [Tanacetum coccineum]
MDPGGITKKLLTVSEEALAAYEATHAANALEAKIQSQNGSDGDNGNGNGRNGNGENRNGRNGNGGNGNPNENDRGARPVARECTYQDFMTVFKPSTSGNLEGVFGLIRWFEKMETVFHISNCLEKYQVKELMKLMVEVYCPRNEIQKIESELLQDVVHIANKLMDQKLKGYAMKNDEIKRRLEVNQRDNRRHMTRDCKNAIAVPTTQRVLLGKKTDEARGKAYVRGGGDANPGSNVATGMFLLNNYYASMLFNSGSDRSFVLTTFSTLLDIIPDTLDVSYVVELADGRISETNTVLRGCTLRLLGHPFNIDLMPVELGSFDVIIGMDWLANHHTVIVCDEKIVRIPYGDEVLIVQGDGSDKGKKSKLSIISYTKTQKYIRRGLVPEVSDFPKVFPEDLPRLPPMRQVEFQIDLVLGAAPVARAPYRLVPSKLQELSTQLQELSEKGFIRPSSSPWGAPDSLWPLRVSSDAVWTDQCTDGIHGSDESGFSKSNQPMNKDDQKRCSLWGGSDKEKLAFHCLKQKLYSASILALPEGSENFMVYCDASRKGLCAVLMQGEKPLRVQALVMTIDLDIPKRILNAQAEAIKEENYGTKDLGGMIKNLELHTDGTLCLRNRSWIPCFGDLRTLIMPSRI